LIGADVRSFYCECSLNLQLRDAIELTAAGEALALFKLAVPHPLLFFCFAFNFVWRPLPAALNLMTGTVFASATFAAWSWN
jgi:hypothetical protein